uniref:Legumain prodomain domain-containing protein n=1 Tax=Ciona savignyi TaxID=51511 RepID=H2Z158_CIOSA
MQYGDLSLSNEIVGIFQGQRESKVKPMKLRPIYDDVPSPDVPIHILQYKISMATTFQQHQQLQLELNKELEMRRRIQWTMRNIANLAAAESNENSLVFHTMPTLLDLPCYSQAIQAFDAMCYELDDHEYAYRQLFVFGNLCDNGVPVDTIVESTRKTCSNIV